MMMRYRDKAEIGAWYGKKDDSSEKRDDSCLRN